MRTIFSIALLLALMPFTLSAKVRAYHNITYADAPRWGVSDLVRFNPSASTYRDRGCVCYQEPFDGEAWGHYSPLPQSEACLKLSVWAPERPDSLLPVLVFIHGGSYHNGGGQYSSSDLQEFAERENIVCVSINYRLGVFGWLYLPDRDIVNLGLEDQANALRWVSRNIEQFGGDPERITVAGQSTGAQSVIYLLATLQEPLIKQAIIFSAPAGFKRTANRAEQYSEEYLRALGGIFELYTLPADSLLRTQLKMEKKHHLTPMLYAPAGLDQQPARMPCPPRRAWVTAQANDAANMVPRWLWSLGKNAAFIWPAKRYVSYLRTQGVDATYECFTWAPQGSPYGASHACELPLFMGHTEDWIGTRLVGDVTPSELDSLRAAFMPRLGQFVYGR